MIGRLILGAMVALAAIYGYPDETKVGVKPATTAVAGRADSIE